MLHDQIKHKQLIWHSRRSMQELDLLLIPFSTNEYSHLSNSEQQEYNNLLELDDNILYKCLVIDKPPLAQQNIINKILDYNIDYNKSQQKL